MRTTAAPVEVVCVQCARPFTVSQRAYAQRTARYGSALRCPHCVGDRWLHVGHGYRVDALLREDLSPSTCRDNWSPSTCQDDH